MGNETNDETCDITFKKQNGGIIYCERAKGREADNVFIWDETNRRINSACSNEYQLKDEARVWFTGATRTRNNLYWVESGKKNVWGQ